MSQTSTNSNEPRSQSRRTDVLGRSALTGKLVLKPASKPGSITMQKALAAVRAVNRGKKK